MEPLSDIGSAAIMLYFIQYVGKACQTVDSLEENKREGFYEGMFVEQTRHFLEFSTFFKSMRHVDVDSNLSQNQKALNRLIENCYEAAGKLRYIFFKIASDAVIKDNNTYLFLRIRKVKEYWKKPETERLLTELDGYGKMVVINMLSWLAIRISAIEEEQSVGFGNGYHGHGKVVEILAVFEDLLDFSNSQNEKPQHEESEDQVPSNPVSTPRHDHIIAAAITFQNGETKFMTRAWVGRSHFNSKQQKIMTLRDADFAPTVEDFKNIQDVVLNSLYFRQFYERLEAVQANHQETYEWIFCPPNAEKPWAPFVEWLESGTGCYYINGKPGSGKSTLMKFIARDQRTSIALEKWASGAPIKASFFFWNLGSPLQKSSIGLLRGLLYDILKQQRGLISVAMPDLWQIAARLSVGTNIDQFTLDDLKRWIRKVLNEATTSLNFFLFIDGIDEFEGDDQELIKLIKDIIENKKVKILLSSRPTPLAEESFSHFPNLRLQDLTRGDIQKYAGDHLSGRLRVKYGAPWAALIDEITNRSYGVFLWVILVVRSLQDGLRDGDSIKEMKDRLDELPSNLKSLYDHMIRSLQPRYQRQASELFQLLLKAQQVHSSSGYPLVIQLSFCDDDPEAVVSLPMNPLDPGHFRDKCDQVSSRIRSRGRGLIESRELQTNRISGVNQAPISSYYVDFIHRTVVEFLRLPEVWNDLISLTSNPKYNPCPELFRSCVIMCKTLQTPRGIDTEVSTLWHMLDRALVYASVAEDLGEPILREHLKQLDTVLATHWAGIMKCFSRLGTCDNQGHWARGFTVDPQRRHILDPIDFSSVALFHGLEDYLVNELAGGPNTQVMDTTLLLFNSLRYIGFPPWDYQTTNFNGSHTSEVVMYLDRQVVLRPRWVNIAIELLQAKSTDLNKPIVGKDSVWSLMVSYVAAGGASRTKQSLHRDLGPEGFANLFAKLLGRFINEGADLDFRATAGAEPAWKLVGQLFSDESSSSERLDPWARQPEVVVNTDAMRMRDYFEHLIAEKKLQKKQSSSF